MPAAIDITGERYGKLVAVERIGTSQSKKPVWLFLCDCGNTKSIAACHARSGLTQSCGCQKAEKNREKLKKINEPRKQDYVGRKSGKLIVLSEVEPLASGVRMLACACACGGIKTVRAPAFVHGTVTSCGCERHAGNRPGRSPLMPLDVRNKCSTYNNQRRSKKNQAGGKFTAAEISSLYLKQLGKCAYCRCSLNHKFHRDHIYPLSRGGSNGIENIQLLCESCNSAKGPKDPIDFAQQMGLLL